MDALILAGGLGTRLREVGLNVPKPLAPINGIPFLEIILKKLEGKVDRVILAIGYKAELIKECLSKKKYSFSIHYSEEKELLGTGGGLKKALEYAKSENVLVLNGDTYLDIDFEDFFKFHDRKFLSMVCLKAPKDQRYGAIVLKDQRIISFSEKNIGDWINGGIYLVKKDFLEKFPKGPFSLEKDVFPFILEKGVFGYTTDAFFIDIGTKESYFEAQECLF